MEEILKTKQLSHDIAKLYAHNFCDKENSDTYSS